MNKPAPASQGLKDRPNTSAARRAMNYPSQLFENVVAKANDNEDLNTDLKAIFTAIESSAMGYDSEEDIKGLFDDFDTTSNRLGKTVEGQEQPTRRCAERSE